MTPRTGLRRRLALCAFCHDAIGSYVLGYGREYLNGVRQYTDGKRICTGCIRKALEAAGVAL
jgi:hypothetical protein